MLTPSYIRHGSHIRLAEDPIVYLYKH